jgi:hypothetical protein
MSALVAFHLSFRALAGSAGTPRDFRRNRELLLSWDSPSSRPSTDRPSARPLPEAEASIGATVPTVAISFHPRGFSPPRRSAPRRSCGFVAPRCRSWGSARFLLPAPRRARRLSGGPSHSPRRISYPSKSSPHQQPYHITVAVALLPLLPALLARTSSTEAEQLSPAAEAARKSATSPLAETIGTAGCRLGREPSTTGSRRLRGGMQTGPDCATTEAAGQTPKGPEGLHRPEPMMAPTATTEVARWNRRVGALPW